MISVATSTPRTTTEPSHVGPARVLDLHPQDRCVLVQFDDDDVAWAHLALAGGLGVQCGDKVLVTGRGSDDLYVIGVLEMKQPAARQLLLDNGGCVVVDDDGQHVRVLDSQQQLLFQYDANSGAMRVAAPTGDLELVAPRGDIRLQAAGEVRLSGQQAIAVTSPRMEVDVVEAELRGARLEAVFDHVRLVGRRLESVAETVLETVRNLYSNVSELYQLKAGRTRTVVDGSAQTKADKVFIKAEGDVKIKGGHVHLG